MKVRGFYFLSRSSVWKWTLSAQKPAKFEWNLVEFHQISSNFWKTQIFTFKFQGFDKSYWSEILHGYWYWYSSTEKIKKIEISWNFVKFHEISLQSWEKLKFPENLFFFQWRRPISILVQNFRSVAFVKPLKFEDKNMVFSKILWNSTKFHSNLAGFCAESVHIHTLNQLKK